MKTNVDILTDIPCFKCLFWEWKKDSHLYCNPNECQKLTEWLTKQAENHQQNKDELLVLATMPSETAKKAQTIRPSLKLKKDFSTNEMLPKKSK